MNLMNKTQATELFEREAVLFGDVNGIPLTRARELLGDEAVDFIHSYGQKEGKRGLYYNGYGNGRFTAMYMTRLGLFAAVTYNNVTALERAEKGA